MIVCHCNVLTDEDIRGAVDELLAEMSLRVITPGLVYKVLGKRGRCCGCFPTAIDIINRHIEARMAADELAERRARIIEQQRAMQASFAERRRNMLAQAS